MGTTKGVPPVLLLSHGTTLLTGEDSHIRDYWLYHGNKAVEYGIKGIIIMVCTGTDSLQMVDPDNSTRELTGMSKDERSRSP